VRRSRIGAIVAAAAFLASGRAAAQRPDSLSAAVRSVLRVSTPRVILEHVNVIDGTGAAAVADRNITIENGRITAIAAGKDEPASEGEPETA